MSKDLGANPEPGITPPVEGTTSKRSLLIIVVLVSLVGLVIILLFAVWPSPERTWKGQSLSAWLGQCDSSLRARARSGQAMSASEAEAREAIRQIGTNALPALLRMLGKHDSFLKEAAMKWGSKQSFLKLNLVPASQLRYQAQLGYSILGPTAREQVPALTMLLSNDPDGQVRQCAAAALGSIGDDAKAAVPTLVFATRDREQFVRNNSFWALSRIHGDPRLVVPVLINGLSDPLQVVRENAVRALGEYGAQATNALPALLEAVKTNRHAHIAIDRISASLVTNAEAK